LLLQVQIQVTVMVPADVHNKVSLSWKDVNIALAPIVTVIVELLTSPIYTERYRPRPFVPGKVHRTVGTT